jgi:hypothetical protein
LGQVVRVALTPLPGFSDPAPTASVRLGEELRALDVQARRAGERDLIAEINAHDADVLAGRLGAIVWATRYRHLDFVWRPSAPEEFFELHAEPGRVLGAETAAICSDAGLHGAQFVGRR